MQIRARLTSLFLFTSVSCTQGETFKDVRVVRYLSTILRHGSE